MYIPTSRVKPKYKKANSPASQKRGREGNSSHRTASYLLVYLFFLLLLLTLWGGGNRWWLFWNPLWDEASVSIYSKRFPAMGSTMLKPRESSTVPRCFTMLTDWLIWIQQHFIYLSGANQPSHCESAGRPKSASSSHSMAQCTHRIIEPHRLCWKGL